MLGRETDSTSLRQERSNLDKRAERQRHPGTRFGTRPEGLAMAMSKGRAPAIRAARGGQEGMPEA
jgi:hypothetical protein